VGYGGGDAVYTNGSSLSPNGTNAGYSYGNGNNSSSGSFREGKQRSPRRNGSFAFDTISSKLKNPAVWGYVLAAIFFWGMMSYRSGQNQLVALLDSRNFKNALVQIRANKQQRESLLSQLTSARDTQRVMLTNKSEQETAKRKLQKEIDELKQKHEGPEREMEKIKIKTREEAWKTQVQLLQQATSRESRRAATEKYVANRVEINFSHSCL
jgi:hypothetical protein